jgi:hypothetical protein
VSGNRRITIGKYTLPLLIWLFAIKGIALGQCVNQVRTYATIQQTNAGLLTSVDNAANAADGNPQNFSTLNRLLGLGLGSVTQYLKFSTSVTAGTPVTIKLSLPSSLLSLLAGVEIQPFTNLRTDIFGNWQADAAGVATTNASLLGLINGAGDMEITIVPKTAGGGAVNYDGVWVSLTGVAVAQSLNLFHAYIKTDAPGGSTIGCSTPVDVLAGTMAGTVVGGIANATGTVTNKWNAIDTDPTFSTYAELNVGAQVLSKVFHTTIFNVSSQQGDFVRMVLQNPGGGLLSLAALSGFTIQLYNGSVAAGPPISSNSGLLSLSLLPSTPDKYQLDITPTVSFDRIEVQMGGLADVSLTQGLRIYDVKRMVAMPAINIDGVAASSKAVCAGNTATLSVNNTQLCTTYKWYDAATGGNLLGTGDTYTPPVANLSGIATNWFYVDATRTGCTEATTRTPVSITVNPLPAVLTATTSPICTGVVNTAITYTSTNTPITYSIVWDGAALVAGFVNITNAILPAGQISVAIPANAPGATYNGIITVKNANGCISMGKPFSITVDAKPTQPLINLTP